MDRKYASVDRILEYSIYAYIFLMFLAKGEGIRNIIIFGGFALWAATIKQRKNIHLLKGPVATFFFLYICSVIFSVILSIDPLLSLKAFKGEALKFGLLFPVIATVMSDEKKLKNVAVASLFTLLLIVGVAYYSYIVYDLEMLTPKTVLVSLWHNKFARFIIALLSISFMLYFTSRKKVLIIFLLVVFAISILALIMSTSRGGYVAFFSMALVWSFFLSRRKGFNLKLTIMSVFIVMLSVGIFSYFYFPSVKARLSTTSEHLSTLNERTELWEQAFQAIKKRPVYGWGIGNSIIKRNEPYKDTPYDSPPVKGIHNMFIKVLFQQGLIGLAAYTLLIFTSILTFWKASFNSTGIKSYMLIACTAVLISNYVVQNMLENVVRLQYLAIFIGLGMAAKGINEDSDN